MVQKQLFSGHVRSFLYGQKVLRTFMMRNTVSSKNPLFRPVGSHFSLSHQYSSIIHSSKNANPMSPAYRANQISSVTMALLMLTVSAMGYFVFQEEATVREELAAEEEARFVTSPGHPVFSQYVTSDNCVYCYQYGSPAHNSIKNQHPDDFVYISYQSVSYGDTDTTRAGNTPGYNWPWSTGGAPDSYWGDRIDKRVSGCGSNTCYDSMFSSGGGMTSATTSQYSLLASVGGSGSNLDVTIEVEYLGSGSPPSSMYLYAAMTEETCYSYSYTDGSRGHNCWKSWLMSDGEYRTQSGGSGSGFQSVALSGGSASYSWSVPSGQVSGGSGNALVVAALMTGAPSTGASSEHVLTATDSNMGPLIDVGITDFEVSNSNGNQGFVAGDTLELEVDVRNNGVEAYNDGGTITIYHLHGGEEINLGSVALNQLGVGGTQSYSTNFDSSDVNMLPSGTSSFRARLSDLVTDKVPGNDYADEMTPHDMPPVPNRPNTVGDSIVQRGTPIQFESTALANDLIDDMSSMTAELQYAAHGSQSWDNAWITSVEVIGSDSNSRYVHTITPPLTATAGSYDVRMQWTDAGGQTSDWEITEDAFALQNALPLVLTSSDDGYAGIPTVPVETLESVSIVGLVNDMETPLSLLTIDSNAPQFISYDSSTLELTVEFSSIIYDNQGAPMSQGIFVTISDGEDTNSGTMLFNVIENGQPRWAGIPSQSFDEGGSHSVVLTQYLTDTDDSGESVPAADLILTIIENSNPELMDVSISGHTLNVAAIDDDGFGMAELTIRASDGFKESDTVISYHVNNVNDAPEIVIGENAEITVQTGDRINLNVIEIVTDVDDSDEEIWITVSTFVPGAVQYNPISGIATMSWDEAGEELVTITAEDRHGSSSSALITVTIVNELPLVWADAMGIGDLLISVESTEYGANPSITITNVGDLELTDIEVHWSVCNSITGICNDFGVSYNFGPFLALANSGEGLTLGDYVGLIVTAVDAENFDRATQEQYKIYATEPVIVDPVDPVDPVGPDDKSPSFDIMSVGIVSIGVLLCIALVLVLALVIQSRRREDDVFYYDQSEFGVSSGSSPLNLPPPPPLGMLPPLPPEGLPAGWTMEQWEYYGAEYLRRRNEP